jgi:hypothetical protein
MLHKLPFIDNMSTVKAICNLRYKCQTAGTEQRTFQLWVCVTQIVAALQNHYIKLKYCWKKKFLFQFWATLKFWELQKIIRLLSVLILSGGVKKVALQKIVTVFYVLLTQGYISCF